MALTYSKYRDPQLNGTSLRVTFTAPIMLKVYTIHGLNQLPLLLGSDWDCIGLSRNHLGRYSECIVDDDCIFHHNLVCKILPFR